MENDSRPIKCQNRFDALSSDDSEAEELMAFPLLGDSTERLRAEHHLKMPRAPKKSSQKSRKRKEVTWDPDAEKIRVETDRQSEAYILTEEARDIPTFTASEWREEKDHWVKVTSIIDSGAVQSIAPPEMAPSVPIVPSPGSKRGQKYLAANGGRIANAGQQLLHVQTEDGRAAEINFQIASVTRPLCSVGEMCDRGNRVLFGRGGGFIQNLQSGELTPFRREGGIYALDFYLPSGQGLRGDPGFAGQGSS
jgi:hypothetical protein